MSRVYHGLLSWLAIACVCACAQAQVKTVSITPANAEGEVGQQLKLTVAGLDESGKTVEQKAMAWAAVKVLVSISTNKSSIIQAE